MHGIVNTSLHSTASQEVSKMSKPKFYAFPGSPPCRGAHLVADCLNLKLDYIKTLPTTGDTQTPEFLAMNPQHTVPVLKDGDVIINESRAIATYLADKYDREGKLFPSDPKQRARVLQRLYFDAGSFFPAFKDIFLPVFFAGVKSVPKDKLEKLEECLGWLQSFVRKGYAAGTPNMTIADLMLLATYSSLRECGIVDTRKYHFVEAWYNRCIAQVPHYASVNQEGATLFGQFFKDNKVKNAQATK